MKNNNIIYYFYYIYYIKTMHGLGLLSKLSNELLIKLLEQHPQLRCVTKSLNELFLGHKKPNHCLYPLVKTNYLPLIYVMFKDMRIEYRDAYFSSRARHLLIREESSDPFDICQGERYKCINCLKYTACRPHNTYRVPHSRGNLDSVVCTCSEKCTKVFDSCLESTDIKRLKGTKFKTCVKLFTNDFFHLSCELPIISLGKIYYHITCTRFEHGDTIEYSSWVEARYIL